MAAGGLRRWLQRSAAGSVSQPTDRRPLVDVLGLGAQRCGTTTLQTLLSRHPGLFLPAFKEVHYFSLHYDKGHDWYAAHYSGAAPGQLRGDITPYYLFHPQAPARIAATVPGARLIVLLRDPVERALSQYGHSRRLGLEPLPLEQALAAEPTRLAGAEARLAAPGGRDRSHQEHSYLSRSRYGPQLARYEALWPQEAMLLLRSEDLFAEPELSWRRIQAFLALKEHPFPGPLPRANAAGNTQLEPSAALRAWMREQLEPTYALMEQRYGLRWPR
ncbi:sulfotransferase domain-containing protein [Synechococcus sp. RSCCF101]|uniref:sulfotransferase domain-containing protein n=1 Tax=Synechococcus sp. RSCCF101 TaxID=2511069 RepID=UPI001786256E|nr:sulfotransferase domain-containing protein [Synechococcus sp. RSCCF101]